MNAPEPERRVLALDVGEKRIGIAISDASASLAAPLTTIQARPQSQALQKIIALAREHQAREIVVGLPLTLRGEIGPQATTINAFADELREAFDGQIHLFDERLTTAAADQMLRDLGMKPEKRKAQIDQVAASIILQDFLDHQRNQA